MVYVVAHFMGVSSSSCPPLAPDRPGKTHDTWHASKKTFTRAQASRQRNTAQKTEQRKLPEKTETLNWLTRKLAGWIVDTHTCQQSQQEVKVERKRGKLNLNAV